MESNIDGGSLDKSFAASSVGDISNFNGTKRNINARMSDMQSENTDRPSKPSCLVEIEQGNDLENKSVQLHSVNDQLPPQGNDEELMGQCDYLALPLIVDIAGVNAANDNSTDRGLRVANSKKSSVMDDSFQLASQNQIKSDIKKETEAATGAPLSNTSDLITENVANAVKESDVSDAQTDNENSESDISEDDVKVCDICGDVGREELLAICSRCSDGAEHTYCMRIMLLKLPESDWLCEECKLKKDDENKKINIKFEDLGVFPNAPLPDLDSKLPATALVKKGSRNSHASNKTSSASTTVATEANTKMTEVDKSDSSLLGTLNNQKLSLVQEASCKLTTSKMKLGNITPHPRNQPATSLVTPAMPSNSSKPEARLLSPRGTLLTMDNLTSKVKSAMETLKPKSKLVSESTVLSVKNEHGQNFVRSASFRSQSTNSSNTDSTSKTHSVNRVDSQHIVLGKQKGIMERKNSLILDRSQSYLSAPASANTMSPKLEQKDARPEGRVGTGEIRKQPPYTPKGVGLLSFNGQPTSLEQKSGQIIPKDESSVNSGTINKISATASDHGPSQSDLCAGRNEKNREAGGLRSAPFPVRNRCQKCNELGHLSPFCSVDKIGLSALKPSALKPSCEQNIRDIGNKTSKWRHVIEAALLKTQTRKSSGLPAQPSDIIFPNNSSSHENSSKDLQSNLAVHDRTLSAAEWTKPAICTGISKIEVTPSGDIVSGIGELKSKSHVQSIFRIQASLNRSLNASAIPELNCIWQGCFEVQRNGQFFDKCYGIQAHLSTLASPKVSNMVTKFPDKVQLVEVSCMSAWPLQFHSKCPMEDNIALFFFATDGESLEKSYNRLLENMLQNDLALKGSLDGVELLIFPSNKLPENCQRWNRLFFLWGVFRASKFDIPVPLNGPQKKFCGDRLDVPNFVRSSTHTLIVEASGKPVAEVCKQGNTKPPVCNKAVISGSQNRDADAYTQNSQHMNNLPSGKQFMKAGVLIEQSVVVNGCSKQTILSDNNQSTDERNDGNVVSAEAATDLGRKHATYSGSHKKCVDDVEAGEERHSPSHEVVTSQWSEAVPTSTQLSQLPLSTSRIASEMVAEGNTSKGKFETKERLETVSVFGQFNDSTVGKESPSWESRMKIKRSSSSSPELVVQAPPVGSSASWKEPDRLSRDTMQSKKMKLGPDERCLHTRDEIHGHEFSSKVHPVHSSFLDEASEGSATCNEVFREGSTSSEMVFFPDFTSSSKELLSSSYVSFPIVEPAVEDAQERDVPNLDLALGAERKPKSGILPLFFPLTAKVTEVKPPDPMMGNGDDGSASLSLSLAFPFPEERRAQREDTLLPERAKPDTSLLLFGRFTEY